MQRAAGRNMVAAPIPGRSLSVVAPPAGLSRALNAFIGSFLELVIHSVEEVRARVAPRLLK